MPNKEAELKALYNRVVEKCFLCDIRTPDTKVVFSSGNFNSKMLLLGEGPGEQEVLLEETFVGPAGQELNKALALLNIDRSLLYLINIILCRTDNKNRTPVEKEWNACRPRMDMQIKIVNPKVILALGVPAGMAITNNKNFKIGEMRGCWTEYKGYPVMHTFHPSFFLHKKGELKKLKKGTPEYMKLFQEIKRNMEYFLQDIREAAEKADQLDTSLPPLLGVKP